MLRPLLLLLVLALAVPSAAAPAPRAKMIALLPDGRRILLPQGAAVPDGALVAPDTTAHILGALSDPGAADQWDLGAMGFPAAWEALGDGAGVTVAVIDTGVDLAHPDLAGMRVVAPHDFIDNDATPQDAHGHGTHVAGTIFARRDNGIGIAGIAPGARLMPLRALDARGSGEWSDVLDAVDWAVARGADVISLSLGANLTLAEQAVAAPAFAAARAAGVLVVAASGNEGYWAAPSFPGAFPSVLGVAATDDTGAVAEFSTANRTVGIAAPGVDILSLAPGGGTAVMSGTSMATPHIAAMAALAMANEPGLTPDELTGLLAAGTVEADVPGFDTRTGAGIANGTALAAAIDAGGVLALSVNSLALDTDTFHLHARLLDGEAPVAYESRCRIVFATAQRIASDDGCDQSGNAQGLRSRLSIADGAGAVISLEMLIDRDGNGTTDVIARRGMILYAADLRAPMIYGLAAERYGFFEGSRIWTGGMSVSEWPGESGAAGIEYRTRLHERGKAAASWGETELHPLSAGAVDGLPAVWSTVGLTGTRFEMAVRAVDVAGNATPWKTVAFRRIPAKLPAHRCTGTWTVDPSFAEPDDWGVLPTADFGGSSFRSASRNARCVFTYTGDLLALWGRAASTLGRYRVTIDGKTVATVDQRKDENGIPMSDIELLAERPYVPQNLFLYKKLRYGRHTVVITRLGGGAIDIDALATLRP